MISNTAKLDYQLGFLVVRGTETTKIHINEIETLIIESTAVSLTAYLLSELIKNKTKVIFCDEKRNPSSELISYYGSHDTSAKIRHQMEWNREEKTLVWTEIVSEKIRNQARFLESVGKKEASMLKEYVKDIAFGDETNREGHAAKVYFNALFGKSFTRAEECPVNAALNYGYSVILSAFNREITANGYITQVGLFHDNMFNQFNLGSDLMEPFRVLVDRVVYNMKPEIFEKEEKHEVLKLLKKEILIGGRKEYLSNAIRIYVRSVFDALNDHDLSQIKFFENEL
ncbi:MAG: type II CRISPR-associated endonuclease Cas1 [Lachnospiraceae bacterium]